MANTHLVSKVTGNTLRLSYAPNTGRHANTLIARLSRWKPVWNQGNTEEWSFSRDRNFQLCDLLSQGIAVEAQAFGSLDLIAAGLFQNESNQGFLHRVHQQRMEIRAG